MKNTVICPHLDGVLIYLRVTTKSSKTGPLGFLESSLKWGVKAPPVDGKANEALINDLAKRLRCAKGRISIHKGIHSKNKVIFVQGMRPEEIDLL